MRTRGRPLCSWRSVTVPCRDWETSCQPALLTRPLKGADTVEEAVGQFYDNPDKYAQSAAAGAVAVPDPTSPFNPKMDPGVAKNPVYAPPVYAPPVNAMGGPPRQHHSNAVIEAGHVRARDEVGSALSLLDHGIELTARQPLARDAEFPAECPAGVWHLQ